MTNHRAKKQFCRSKISGLQFQGNIICRPSFHSVLNTGNPCQITFLAGKETHKIKHAKITVIAKRYTIKGGSIQFFQKMENSRCRSVFLDNYHLLKNKKNLLKNLFCSKKGQKVRFTIERAPFKYKNFQLISQLLY
jgi:hypothetical protein